MLINQSICEFLFLASKGAKISLLYVPLLDPTLIAFMLAHEIYISAIISLLNEKEMNWPKKLHYRVLLLDAVVRVINLYV